MCVWIGLCICVCVSVDQVRLVYTCMYWCASFTGHYSTEEVTASLGSKVQDTEKRGQV
jgi:hypothetical protein